VPVINVTPEAEADILDACKWYNGQKEGLGLEFFDEVVTTVERIEDHPVAYNLVHKNVRRAVVRRFPYYIIYTVAGDQIQLIACLHASRSPEAWKSRFDT